MKINETPVRGRGRPREFDRNKALSRALPLFWERGYEGTSIAALVNAMGINPPALYAAFGSKDALYLEVLELYFSPGIAFDPTIYFDEATAYEVVSRFLREAAISYCLSNRPRGCMVASGMLAYAPEHQAIAARITKLRTTMRNALERRFRAACDAGDLPEEADPASLAIFYAAVLQGMSVQAKDGADQASLMQVAEKALLALPTSKKTLSTKGKTKRKPA